MWWKILWWFSSLLQKSLFGEIVSNVFFCEFLFVCFVDDLSKVNPFWSNTQSSWIKKSEEMVGKVDCHNFSMPYWFGHFLDSSSAQDTCKDAVFWFWPTRTSRATQMVLDLRGASGQEKCSSWIWIIWNKLFGWAFGGCWICLMLWIRFLWMQNQVQWSTSEESQSDR